MKCVEWNDKFNLGLHEIDDQHKQLVAIMNKICQAINEGRGDKIIEEVLIEMQDYALNHFELEEKYFDQFHYEKSELHKEWHRTFIQKIVELADELDRDKKSVSIEAIAFLGGWFIDHTQNLDRQYVALFKEHGVS